MTAGDAAPDPEVRALIERVFGKLFTLVSDSHGRAARESEERYRTIVRHAPVVFFLLDRDGVFTLCEGQALEAAGVSPASVVGRSAFELFGTVPVIEDTGRVSSGRDVITRVLAGETVKGVTELGGRLFENSFIPMRDAAGAITGEMGVAFDITERQKAHDALRRSEEQFRAMIEHSSEIISLHDAAGIMRYQSPSITGVLGYGADELVGQAVLEFIHPDDRAETAARIDRIRARPGPHPPFETRFRHKDGRWLWFECAGTNLLDDPILGQIVFNAHDITARKDAERDLRQSEERFRTMVEQISDVLAILSEAGVILYESPSVSRVLGYRADERAGHSVFEFVHPDDTEGVRTDLAALRRQPTLRAFRCRHRDGSWRILEGTGQVIGAGEPLTRILVTLRDVTARRALEDELRQIQKLESIGQLAGGIAHDFNNILTVINGYSELALEDLPDDHARRADLEEIRKAGDRAATLTYQLLAFSRKQVLQPRVLDLNEMVAEVEKMLGRLIGEHILLETRLDAAPALITADPGQVTQVLMNIAANARDAMPDGGRLLIETSNVEVDGFEPHTRVAMVPGPYILLVLRDSGTGMEEATQQRIFEPFFTTKTVGKGTGMGLATVYGIVKQSGGYIWVSSEPGRGSAFRIYLPCASRGEAERTGADDLAPIPSGSETILLVEDEPQVRKLTCQILESCGYTVIVAEDGRQALDLCRDAACEVDLLLTDVVMPHLGGPALAAVLSRTHPDVRVLFMSGHTDEAVVHHGILAAGTSFLQKPFSASALSRAVRAVLDRRTSG